MVFRRPQASGGRRNTSPCSGLSRGTPFTFVPSIRSDRGHQYRETDTKIENGPGTPYAVSRPGIGGLLGVTPSTRSLGSGFGTFAQKHRAHAWLRLMPCAQRMPVACARAGPPISFSWGSIAAKTSGAASRPPGAVVQLAWVVIPCSPGAPPSSHRYCGSPTLGAPPSLGNNCISSFQPPPPD